jgi:hypothetical protein
VIVAGTPPRTKPAGSVKTKQSQTFVVPFGRKFRTKE